MNDLSLITTAGTGGTPRTMSSREIADLTGSTHDNVLKTVRALAAKGVVSKNETPYIHAQNGQTYIECLLTFRDTMVVVSGYSAELRAKIIDRWQELEAYAAAATKVDLNDPTFLRSTLLTYTEKVIALQHRVDEMQPKVEALEQISEAHGTFNRTTAAKMLGVPPQVLIRWLSTNGWTYRRPGTREDIAYQSKIQNGCLEHKITTGPRPDGTEWASTSVRVTAKGLAALAQAFPKSVDAA